MKKHSMPNYNRSTRIRIHVRILSKYILYQAQRLIKKVAGEVKRLTKPHCNKTQHKRGYIGEIELQSIQRSTQTEQNQH